MPPLTVGGCIFKNMKSCPECKSKTGLRKILYGYPDPTVTLDESKYVLGGCCISQMDPTIKCIECGWEGESRKNQMSGLID
jgi:hypothetical protein